MKPGLTIITIFLIVLLYSAGCMAVHSTDQNSGTTKTAEPRISLEAIALNSGDVSGNVTVLENRQKQPTDVSDLALNLGWQGGYIVRFVTNEDSFEKPTIISQNIAIYPKDRMQNIVDYVVLSEKKNSSYTFVDLPDPGIGDYSIAYTAYKSNETSSLTTTSPSAEYYEIIFTKGEVFEVLQMRGPAADFNTILNFAKTAYKKL